VKVTTECGASHNHLNTKPVFLNTTNAASTKIVICVTSGGHLKSLLKFWKYTISRTP